MNNEQVIVPVPVQTKGMTLDTMQGKTRREYCSFTPQTEKEKIELFNALQQCDERIMDNLGKTIYVKNVICQEFQRENDETGEITNEVRTVLIDAEGKTYGTASRGIYVSLCQIFKAFGEPNTWEKPMPIVIKERTTGKNRKTYTIELVSE